MISLLSTRPIGRPAEDPAPAPPAPVPAPPAPPSDPLDFSKIDCPTKALLLPVAEPALELALGVGFMNALMAGSMGQPIPMVTIDVASKSADKIMKVSYQLDLKNQENPLSVYGDVAGQAVTDSLKTGQAGTALHLTGAIGQNRTDLVLDSNDADQNLSVDGKLGDVDAHMKFTALGPSRDGAQGFRVEGTLGGQPYAIDTVLDAAGAIQRRTDAPGPQPAGTMTVRGKLGDADISKDYTLISQSLPTGRALSFSGRGTTSGVPQEVAVTLTMVQ